MEFLTAVLGIVLIIEGIPWFLSPQGAKKFLLQALAMPDKVLRLLGLAAMMAGLFMVWLARG